MLSGSRCIAVVVTLTGSLGRTGWFGACILRRTSLCFAKSKQLLDGRNNAGVNDSIIRPAVSKRHSDDGDGIDGMAYEFGMRIKLYYRGMSWLERSWE